MNIDSSSFSLDEYGKIVHAFVKNGYQIQDFESANPDSPDLILRHDIDVSLPEAEKLAVFEMEQGWQAYYFVLLTTEQYNPASARGRAVIRKLAALGHHIGLHFDASIDTAAELDERARHEAAMLADIAETSVSMISFHRPSKHLIGNEKDIGGFAHTYQPKFFRDMGYCSDSRGGWYHGKPTAHPAFKARKALQLLTHPIWWTGAPRPGSTRLLDHLNARESDLEIDLSENISLGSQTDTIRPNSALQPKK